MRTLKYIIATILLILFQFIGYSQTGTWRIVDSLKIYVHGSEHPIGVISVAIDCADTSHCAIAERYNWIYPLVRISDNGGESWRVSMIDTLTPPPKIDYYIRPFEIDYPDTSLCVMVCDAGYCYISRDKCRTWDMQRLDTNAINDIYFFNKNIGAVAGHYNLFLTTDGGYNWKTVNRKDIIDSNEYIPDLLEYIYYKSKDTVYLLCFRYDIKTDYILKSVDGGNTWKFLCHFDNRIIKFLFLNDTEAVAIGIIPKKHSTQYFRDAFYKSYDGGKTWDLKMDSLTESQRGPRQLYFSDEKNGVALGTYWDLWRTSDGGDTWFQDTSYYNPRFVDYGVDIALLGSTRKFLIVNEMNGYVIKYSEDGITDIVEPDLHKTESFKIYQNIISSGETIKFVVPETGPGNIRLVIYNSLGICTDSFEFNSPGNSYLLEYTLPARLAAGRYFVKLVCGSNQAVKTTSFIVK